MTRLWLSALLGMALVGPSAAADVELEARLGQALPSYEQSFTFDPGPAAITIPGATHIELTAREPFRFDGNGGSSFGASLTLYPASVFGIEARIDSAAVDIVATGAVYHVRANLPFPLPDLSTDVALNAARVTVSRIRPLSLNLKLRTRGRVGLSVSGGVSYLPTIRLTAEQPIGLGLGSLALRADLRPENDEARQRVGVNVGAGLRLRLAGSVLLTAEARVFTFPRHRVEWTPATSGPLSSAEQLLLDRATQGLDPIEFNPTFYQATLGLVLRL